MSESTIIAWTDHTFNIAWGCTKVSPGCTHCYAEAFTHRLGLDVWGQSARKTFSANHWRDPERWHRAALREGRRHKVFSSSMCDIFEDHPTIAAERAKLWPLIAATPALDWQLLTKRPERIADCLPDTWGPDGWPNVWLGTSIETDAYRARAETLRAIPAVVRFISYEPALGPLETTDLRGIDWVICGGESGGNYRPMDLAWPRALRRRCKAAGVAFFFKQSAAPRTEMGITLDGKLVREYPRPRQAPRPGGLL